MIRIGLCKRGLWSGDDSRRSAATSAIDDAAKGFVPQNQDRRWAGRGPHSAALDGTVRLSAPAATDDHGRTVWTWKGDAFGATLPDEDPDGDGRATSINLRFPGQYFDSETGLHYNWHRWYEPGSGRYVSSDPIGLRGGNNTVVYANASPERFPDSQGLQVSFGHGARHLSGTGIDSCEVEEAIRNCIAPMLPFTSPGAGFWGRVSVGGASVIYRAMPFPGGCHVGTYYLE